MNAEQEGERLKEHRWIPSRGQRLSAMLHLPVKNEPKRPIVMICHGFTGDKIGMNQMNVKLAVKLEDAGYASVRFDYLGSGDSDGDLLQILSFQAGKPMQQMWFNGLTCSRNCKSVLWLFTVIVWAD